MNSSNNQKNFSGSSGIMWSRMKEFSNYNKNNNPILVDLPYNNNHPKGRKLIEDFDKFTNNKNNKKEEKNNNQTNNSPAKLNISNNNFSFLTPNNNKPEKENEKEEEKKSENKNIINENSISANHNMFFTDCGMGYKCNCQKTQCNKYYCQCFREGRYCFNCNCTDCNNKKPESFPTNKHKIEEEPKDKKQILVSCTCTKSGCNKNYCECFKSKVKCNSLCRCRNCENCEEGKIEEKNEFFQNFECCLANSVFIVKNKIVLEDIDKKKMKKSEPIKREIKIMISEHLLSSFSSDDNENIGHKRKRKKEGNMEIEIEKSMSNKKSKLSDENTEEATKSKNKNISCDDGLFDKNGKLIITNFKL